MDHDLRQALSTLGQQRVLNHYDQLDQRDAEAASHLLHQLGRLDLQALAEQRELLAPRGEQAPASDAKLEPGPMLELASETAPYQLHPDAQSARDAGEDALEEGKVAALLLAGGQGTRLGFDLPKGLFPIYPLSERCLFDGYCAQLQALARYSGETPLLLVMTSAATHEITLQVFQDMDYFGLLPERVRFFQQAQLPALNDAGELLLADNDQLALSPDGHGGTLTALAREGLIDELQRAGVEWLFTFQVDNPAVSICDPRFVGLSVVRDADASLQAVRKREASERVGVFGYRDGAPAIIEYSELSEDEAQARTSSGALAWAAGNCAVHTFKLSFLQRFMAEQASNPTHLPLHLAHKKVPHVNEAGDLIEPDQPNGWKFERFIFDCLPQAQGVFALEIPREEHFLPVKSAEGETSPDAVRKALQTLWRNELRRLGLALSDAQPIEISPELWADRQQLAQLVDQLRPDLERAIADPTAALLIEG